MDESQELSLFALRLLPLLFHQLRRHFCLHLLEHLIFFLSVLGGGLSLSSFLGFDGLSLFLLLHTSFVDVNVECVRKQHRVSVQACSLRIELLLVPVDSWKDAFSKLAIVSLKQTLSELRGHQLSILQLRDLLSEQNFKLFVLGLLLFPACRNLSSRIACEI